jgi:hypothetical protein
MKYWASGRTGSKTVRKAGFIYREISFYKRKYFFGNNYVKRKYVWQCSKKNSRVLSRLQWIAFNETLRWFISTLCLLNFSY